MTHLKDIVVRRTVVSDAKALATIYGMQNACSQTLQLPYPSQHLWQQRIENTPENIHSLVAEFDGEIVGNIGLVVEQRPRRNHTAHIGMAVHDSFVGKGIGSALMTAVVDLADNWLNIRRLELTVYVDNENAIALYRKFGFAVEGEAQEFAFRDGDYVNAYYMARLLNQSI